MHRIIQNNTKENYESDSREREREREKEHESVDCVITMRLLLGLKKKESIEHLESVHNIEIHYASIIRISFMTTIWPICTLIYFKKGTFCCTDTAFLMQM